jgi:hypothetical protein
MSSLFQPSNLQAVLAATSYGPDPTAPHHPITCQYGRLSYDEDNRLRCDHTVVPPNDARTQSCLNHSMAVLLLELASAGVNVPRVPASSLTAST